MRRPHPLLAVAGLCAVALAGAPVASASTPSDSGSITPAEAGVVTQSWTGTVAVAHPLNDCTAAPGDTGVDHHAFTLTVPAGFYDTHVVTMNVVETATAADSILTVLRGMTKLASSDNSAVGGSESYTVDNPPAGTYDALTCSFAGASPYTASVTLTTKTPPVVGVVGGTSTTAAPSTYGNYSLAAVPGTARSGEPSIGVDWGTGNVYFQASLRTVKAVFPPGDGAPAVTDVSCTPTTLRTLDPIAFTDSTTGRTGVSQLAASAVGLNSITNFFEGNPTAAQTTCMPSQGGGEVAGPDHQTLGGGTYPKVLPLGVGPTGSYKRAFYYCSQTIAAGALCSRSDDGGTTFVNGQPPYTTECGGLHGHVRVGPEGNVYLPNKSCGATQGLAVSTDAGGTWKIKPVTGSTPGATDPSVSADRAGNVYFGYVDGDGKPAVSVSPDAGSSWASPVKVGAATSTENAVWAEVIAGDAGRAAMAFVGTPTAGNRNDPSFGKNAAGTSYVDGEFHLYVATTVDRGASWKTVDITPTDPIQRGQICTDGTTCMGGRNLLDFNDITVDKDGRVLVGYSDGCTAACVGSALVADNKQTAQGYIARQTSGPLLFAGTTTDPGPTPDVPEAPVALLLPLAALTGLALVVRRQRSRTV